MSGPRTPRAWQRMLSGRRLDLLDPSPLDVEISDIAHGLARVARWNGQTRGEHALSVAQHSLLVEVFFTASGDSTPDEQMTALLHDAPEYVIGDMISPFKAMVGGDYKAVERRLEAAIHLRFGLPAHAKAELKARIKRADCIAAFIEATELAGFSHEEGIKLFGPPKGYSLAVTGIVPLSATDAQAVFLARFADIENERAKHRAQMRRIASL